MLTTINELANVKPMDSDLRTKTKQVKEASTEHPVSQDRFDLSSTSLQLEALIASLNEDPEVNAARVLYFKAEIELGNYQIKSQQIAKKLLNQFETA